MTMGRAIGGTVEKVRSVAQAPGLSDVDGHALAGFIEAEGCFTITPNNGGRNWKCAMSLVQRAATVIRRSGGRWPARSSAARSSDS